MALYRRVGSTGVMAAQMRHVATVAAMPNVTVTIMPAIAHPANASGFIIAGDSAAYAAHVAGGFTYTDEATFQHWQCGSVAFEGSATASQRVRR
jgi:hypothetical protein